MVKFSEDQIDSIAREIVSRLARSDEDTNQPEISSYTGELVKGIFPDINSAVEAVYVAQKKYMEIPLQERNKIISHIRKKMLEHGDELAREANAETGLGRYEAGAPETEISPVLDGKAVHLSHLFAGYAEDHLPLKPVWAVMRIRLSRINWLPKKHRELKI